MLTNYSEEHLSARAVFFNRLGEIRDRKVEQQRYRAIGLNLVTAAIELWNTTCLKRATRTLATQATTTDENPLQILSPLASVHINLAGDYIWRTGTRLGPVNSGRFDCQSQLNVLQCPFLQRSVVE